jgi:cytosol alanyl aminopeptidase
VKIRGPLASLAVVSLALGCGGAAEPSVTPNASSSAPSSPALDDPAPRLRLPGDARPTAESLEIHIDPKAEHIAGTVEISVSLERARAVLWLHGKNLHVTRATATPEGGAEVAATWKQENDGGLASLRFARPIGPGKAKLHLEYDAPFGPRSEGLYKVKDGELGYAFTQFESIAARTAFPCFDEPAFKIPFSTTLVVPKDDLAISNTREIARKVEGSSLRVTFAPTLPLPSYLMAFAVGPLDVVPAPDLPPNDVRKRPLPLRAVTMKGHGKDVAYALAHTGDFVALLERFVGLEYPYDKLDIIAVGDKGGAMENAGAITFGDFLLLFDEKTAPLYQRRIYAIVMAHELAHQWVGDLVTAGYWDDIWLNEAFATWIEAKIVDEWNPKLEARLELLNSVQNAIGSDALVSARAIRQPIESPDDIENAFDGITYDKGGGVLSMFERWVGPDAFRRGLHDYLAAHRLGNATADDFLNAESAAAGKDVKTPFHTFLDQPGVPFVEAEVKCDGAPRLHLKQSRYFPLGSAGDPNKTWQIPICARYQVGGESKEACTLLTSREGDLPLGGACPEWVLPNADAAGYFRFALAPADLAKLTAKGVVSLSVREKTAYANSLRAAFNRNAAPMQDIIAAAAVLATDPHRSIAMEPLGFVQQARDWLYEDKLRGNVERYADKLYKGVFANLGWSGAKDEGNDRKELRRTVISALAFTARDAAVRAEAKKLGLGFLGAKKDGKIHADAVDPDLAGIVLGVVGEDVDRALWDSVKAQLAKTDDQILRGHLLSVLTSARSADLVPLIRDLAFDPILRPTEVTAPVWALLGRDETRDATWQWVKANFDRLLAAVPKHHGQTQLISMGGVFCDDAHAADVQSFFSAEKIAKIEGAPRVLASTLEEVRLCAAKRKVHEPSARAFFAKQ